MTIAKISKTFHLPKDSDRIIDLHVRSWHKSLQKILPLREEIGEYLPGEILLLQDGNTLDDTYIITAASPSENSFLFLLRADDETLRSLHSSVKRVKNSKNRGRFVPSLEVLNKFKKEEIQEWYWYVQSVYLNGKFSPSTLLVSGSLKEAIQQSAHSTETTLRTLLEIISTINDVPTFEPKSLFELRSACYRAFADCFELHVNEDAFKPSLFDLQSKKRYIPKEDWKLPTNELVEFESFSHQMKGGFSFSVFCGNTIQTQTNKSFYMTANFDKNLTAVGMASGPIMATRKSLNLNLNRNSFETSLILESSGDSFWETLSSLKTEVILCLSSVIAETGFLYGAT